MRRLDDLIIIKSYIYTMVIEDPANKRRHGPSHKILCDPDMTLVNHASMQLSEYLITNAWNPIGCDWRSAVAARLQKSEKDCGKNREIPNDKVETLEIWRRT